MKKIIGRTLLLLAIAYLGYVLGVLHALTIWSPTGIQVKHDFDLTSSYFFQGKTPPITGTIPAGKTVNVVMRKGDAALIQVCTTVSMSALKKATETE